MRLLCQLGAMIPAAASGLTVGYAARLVGAPSPVPGTAAVGAALCTLLSLDLLAGVAWPNWQVTVGRWPARGFAAARRLVRFPHRTR